MRRFNKKVKVFNINPIKIFYHKEKKRSKRSYISKLLKYKLYALFGFIIIIIITTTSVFKEKS